MNKYCTFAALWFLGSCSAVQQAELAFQNDADLIRLEHLRYWTGLIDEYAAKTGVYPFQRELASPDAIGFVNIATPLQRARMKVATEPYLVRSVAELVTELETELRRPVYALYDIQAFPDERPIGYYYYVTKRGYTFRVSCITCGATELSPLHSDGITSTITVASEGMLDEVPHALLREELLAHEQYKDWTARPFISEEQARTAVARNLRNALQ